MGDPFRAGRLSITERDRDYWQAECERLRAAIRPEAEKIIALASGPWSKGQNLPVELREPMIIRSEHYRKHAQAIFDVLGEEDDEWCDKHGHDFEPSEEDNIVRCTVCGASPSALGEADDE